MAIQIEHDKWIQPDVVLVRCGSDAYKHFSTGREIHKELIDKVLEKHGRTRVWSVSARKKGDVRFRHIRFTGNRITGRKDLDTSMLFFDYEEVCAALDYLMGLEVFDSARLIEHIEDRDDTTKTKPPTPSLLALTIPLWNSEQRPHQHF